MKGAVWLGDIVGIHDGYVGVGDTGGWFHVYTISCPFRHSSWDFEVFVKKTLKKTEKVKTEKRHEEK